MSGRREALWAAAVLLAALVAGCLGAGADPQGSELEGGEGEPLHAALTAIPAGGPGKAFFVLAVAAGERGAELTFPSGQTFDFAVRDGQGRQVWLWSQGRTFTMALREESWPAGTVRLFWVPFDGRADGRPLAPGAYTVEAWLTAHPRQRAQTSFEVEPATGGP